MTSKVDRWVRGTVVPIGLRLKRPDGTPIILPCPPDTVEIHFPDGRPDLQLSGVVFEAPDHYRFDYQTTRGDENPPGNYEATFIFTFILRNNVETVRAEYFFELVNDL